MNDDLPMSEQEVAHACEPDAEHCSCVPHLRAEIERLRAQRVLDNEEAARLYDFARDKGKALERAAVVAYLRERQPGWPAGSGGHADAIENGEHRPEEKKP